MPDFRTFVDGFGFVEGNKFDNYRIFSVNGDETTVKRYHQYSYIINIDFVKTSEGNLEIEDIIKLYISRIGKKIIYTKYGNPYQCEVEYVDFKKLKNDHYLVKLIGKSMRVYS